MCRRPHNTPNTTTTWNLIQSGQQVNGSCRIRICHSIIVTVMLYSKLELLNRHHQYQLHSVLKKCGQFSRLWYGRRRMVQFLYKQFSYFFYNIIEYHIYTQQKDFIYTAKVFTASVQSNRNEDQGFIAKDNNLISWSPQ